MAATSSPFVLPEPLELDGNLAANWKSFSQSFDIYLKATDLVSKDDNRKIAILLNVIGQEGVKIYNTFNIPDPRTLDAVLAKFKEYADPKKNVLHSRYVFTKRVQKEGEPFDSFLTDLKTLVKNCEFTDEDGALRDKLVFSAADQNIRAKLIKKGNPTLDEVIKAFRYAEINEKQVTDVIDSTKEKHVSSIKTRSRSQSKNRTCSRCV